MFVMNAPPVVALQTKWGSYGPGTNYKFPVCFSESEEDVSGTPLTAQVQMIINNLQSDESSDVKNEYICIMQKNRKGETYINNGLATDSKVVKGHNKERAKLIYSTDFGTEEEHSEFGPLVLDSDSDDSVDRGIEEAIQEYLKKKSEAGPSHPADAEWSNHAKDETAFNKNLRQTERHSMLPVRAEAVCNNSMCDKSEIHEKLRCASPASISSDDSFEQSIRAEIEQFLNEKKQQGAIKSEATVMRQVDQKGLQAKLDFKPNKGMDKTNCSTFKQGCKNTLIGRHSELRKTNTQLKCLNSKSFARLKHFGKDKRMCKVQVTRPLMERNDDYKHQCAQAVKTLDEELSNSSSDDGIEEAIQLYQLEKNRKEFIHRVHSESLQKEQFMVKTEDSSADVAVSPSKSASADAHKKPASRKRKQTTSKSVELSKSGSDVNLDLKPFKRSSSTMVDKTTKCEQELQASYRAETAAELLCAEAILDISKTIIPFQIENHDDLSIANPISCPKRMPPCSESDSSVDSDDGIEQEIRSFLALKAQSATLTPADSGTLTKHSNLTVGHSSFSKSKLSLTRKRKVRDESKVVQVDLKTNCEGSERCSSQVTDCSNPRNSLCQGGSGYIQSWKPVDLKVKSRYMTPSDFSGTVDENEVLEAESTLEPLHGNVGILRGGLQVEGIYCPGDKSSSLDSDEDLDAAIKDLLRSKRKLKKKSKEQKPQYRKKVRFGNTETQVLDKFENIKPKEWKHRNPSLLKSCLSKPKKDVKENALNKSQNLKRNLDAKTLNNNMQVAFQLQKDNDPKSVCNLMNLTAIESEVISETDDSSVDSDDSIEQEIRKFLAEKAKESISTALQEDTLNPSKTNLEDKGKYQTQNGNAVLNLDLTGKLGSQRAKDLANSGHVARAYGFNECEQSMSYTGHLDHSTTEVTTDQNFNQSITRSDSPFGNGEHLVRKTEKNMDHSEERFESASIEGRLQNNLNPETISVRRTFQVQFSGSFLADLKHIPGKEEGMLVEGQTAGPMTCRVEGDARLMPPANIQNAFTDNWNTNRMVQSENLSLEKDKEKYASPFVPGDVLVSRELDVVMTEKDKEKTDSAALLKKDDTALCLGKDPLLCKETVSLTPTQGFSTIRNSKQQAMLAMVQGDGIMQGNQMVHISAKTVVKQNISIQMRCNIPEGGIVNSEREVSEHQVRGDQKEDQGQEDGSKLNTLCVEDSKRWKERGKVSDFLMFSSFIDPGLVLEPYIVLSPEHLCRKFSFITQNNINLHQKGHKYSAK
ncbi:protein phosphatase 1 regulatory subunit 26 [Rhinatrema bivittatum]|uniref:protein phosphatase 1 regulatory subunit 26 n=1 Tax=Rhinatrema bivittatum TaxID=194408 RepID=UPI0011277D40|nr:protein phosphatase 1 regulatory subunit 26 [Rhinatrema bivittatum]XP_029467550.1 protein phosphatase 1 regulatory subunit 26 [Rhinatrema bivittatum]